MADNETIADIRKDAETKFRELVEAYIQRRSSFQTTMGAMQAFNNVFDRLEAAYKRERGDAAKLREALTKILDLTNSLDEGCAVYPVEIRDIAKAALAEPARNCDVGTADDWLARFNVVCERCSGSDCDHRLFKDEEVCDCFARWLQMPYEEGGEK